MKFDPINRRMFLRGAGSLAVGLPLLPSLLPTKDAAAENTAPGTRRFIAIQSYGSYRLDGKDPTEHLLDYDPAEHGLVLPGLTNS
ncbi:MAG: hypothetical protein AAGF11_42660 [Myxococcota bacterium]